MLTNTKTLDLTYSVICTSHTGPESKEWNGGKSAYSWRGKSVIKWGEFKTEREAYFFAHEIGGRYFGYRFEIVPTRDLSQCH